MPRTHRTAILSALAQEQRGLLEQLDAPSLVNRAGREFWLGALHGKQVVLALARIGKVAAATTVTTLIEAFSVDRVVFTGVAGALGQGIHVGDVVVASQFVQHDMDASPLFARFEIPLYARTLFDCDPTLTALLMDASRQMLEARRSTRSAIHADAALHQGLVASGDRFVATADVSRTLKLSLNSAGMEPLAVEMEGAAAAQVCADYGVPFAAVRTISDRADEHAALDFQQFLDRIASQYALGIVDRLMRALPA